VRLTVPHGGQLRSYVALGDSFTEGLADDLGPAGRHRGWADRVAAALALRDGGIRYANLAVRGRLLDAVLLEQVPVAAALAPDLVSFQAGGNDLLRPRVDVPHLLDRYEHTVELLRAGGGEVLLFTFVGRTGGSGRTATLLAGRFTAFNAHVRQVAERHGCPVADLGSAAATLGDRRLWHDDRIHLAPGGHARVAAAALEALGVRDARLLGGEPGWWREPLSAHPPAGRGTDLVADVRWVRRYVIPWVSRRVRGVSSGDDVLPKHPELVEVLPPGS
jgi:lysophospholipase L1-like esterase